MHALFISTCALGFVAITAKPLGGLNEDFQGLLDPVSLDPSFYNSALSDSSDQNSLFFDPNEGTHHPAAANFSSYPETIRKICNID